jgi:hypothetical protein
MGKDFTLFAKQPGIVVYQQSKYIRKVRFLWWHHGNSAATIWRGWRHSTLLKRHSGGLTCVFASWQVTQLFA